MDRKEECEVSPYMSKGYRLFRKLMRVGYSYAEAMAKLSVEQAREARECMAHNQRTARANRLRREGTEE